jgi:sugar O-acyltransferase (sialic acid O-acetyltransferase NeuD family)
VLDKQIVIAGYSGHGLVVIEAALQAGINIAFYTEKVEAKNNPFNLKYLGFEEDVDFLGWQSNYAYTLGIGDNYIRTKIANRLELKNIEILSVIHPSANLSEKLSIGNGVFIARNASINPFVSIGNYCILNTGCIIEHECRILNSVHIAPGAVLAGNVEVGNNTFIGANATIKQGVKIGSDVIVGAGTVVLKDIPNGKKVVGNPGRTL